MRIPGSIPPGNDIHIMHCPPLVVKCFFAFHRFLQKGHYFVICFVRIDESAQAYVWFFPEFPVFAKRFPRRRTVFSMEPHFCMKAYMKLHKHDFADTVPPITGHSEPRLREKAVREITRTAQRVKKASQSLPPAGGKGILIIFCQGMYLTENTTQAASVRFVRQRRTNRARGRLQSFCQKRALPFFDSLEVPLYRAVLFLCLDESGKK